jgi:molybdopterin converting factor small subunit
MSDAAPARVVLTTGFSQRYTGGVKEFGIEATTLRGVIKAMEARFPGLGEILEEETNVAIDGVLHEVVYTQKLKAGCEVFFIPRIEGG